MKKGDLVVYFIQMKSKYGPRIYKISDIKEDRILIEKGWVKKEDYKIFKNS